MRIGRARKPAIGFAACAPSITKVQFRLRLASSFPDSVNLVHPSRPRSSLPCRRSANVLFHAALAAMLAGQTAAQAPRLWGDLHVGPQRQIGFTSVQSGSLQVDIW